MNLINKGDLIDIGTKLKQRGIGYFLSKVSVNNKKRTESTFGQPKRQGSNWWQIPLVKQRQNELISGDRNTTLEEYLINRFLKNKQNLKMLSVGCGTGNHELYLAQSGLFSEVIGIDLSPAMIRSAKEKATERKLTQVHFQQADFYKYNLKPEYFDIVFFHSSLHHFKGIDQIIKRITKTLKVDGLLIINEYVGNNRLQFATAQILEMNRLLATIPSSHRQRYLSQQQKNKIYSPGLVRMVVSDPSEAVESERILPAIHKHFLTLEEKRTGGDLLMMILKDIAHHFTNQEDQKTRDLLCRLFEMEDEYLSRSQETDFIFGVYQKKT